jgi:hypothetical protein
MIPDAEILRIIARSSTPSRWASPSSSTTARSSMACSRLRASLRIRYAPPAQPWTSWTSRRGMRSGRSCLRRALRTRSRTAWAATYGAVAACARCSTASARTPSCV